MIAVQTKIHDKFSLEFKVLYKAQRKAKSSDFYLDTWLFVPNSLDINPSTYKREDFYKDIRTNTRLITPVFLLRDIVDNGGIPINNLQQAMQLMASKPTKSHNAEYEYQIKMFAAIYKSALRDQINYIHEHDSEKEKTSLIEMLLIDIDNILNKYRALHTIIKAPTVSENLYNYYNFGDEFMCNLTEKELFKLCERIKKDFKNTDLSNKTLSLVIDLLENEKKHKQKKRYLKVKPDSENKNSDLVFRLGALKKFIESDLFLKANKKRDGVIVEQVYFSIAAGISMIFATAIAFSFQIQYGNFTMPLFVALVVSYMLKDRIKELMRYYLAQKISRKHYDNKIEIAVKDKIVGISKEVFDFIKEDNVPSEVLKTRNRIPLIEAENRYAKEKIILYRKSMRIFRDELNNATTYDLDGVAEIIRLNFQSFMRKADNPEVQLFALNENNELEKITGKKNYYINIILSYNEDNDKIITRYRVGFNRNGIESITKM